MKWVPCLPLLTVPARFIHRAIYLVKRCLDPIAGLVGLFDLDKDYPMVLGRISIADGYPLDQNTENTNFDSSETLSPSSREADGKPQRGSEEKAIIPG